MPLDVARAHRPGDEQGLLGPCERLREPAAEHQDLRQGRDSPRTRLGRWLRGDEAHRGAIRLEGERALRREPCVSTHLLVQQTGADRVGGLGHQPDGGLDVRHGPRRLMEPRHPGQRREHLDPIGVGALVRVRHLAPQVERSLVLAYRLGIRVAPFCGTGGDHRCRERPRQLVRRVPVMGQLGCPCRAPGARLQRARERGMQAGPLAGEQVVVDRLLQRVPERDAVHGRAGARLVAARDQHLPRDALAQRLMDRVLVHPGRGCQQLRVDALPGRGRDAQELLGRLGEVRDARQEHIPQGRRQLHGALLPHRREQLLREEGIATRAAMDGLQQRAVEVVAGDGPELRVRRGPVEALEVDPFRVSDTVELGHELQQRMPPVQLVGAVREQQHHAGRAQVAHEEPHEVAVSGRTSACPR